MENEKPVPAASVHSLAPRIKARVAELADALDLGNTLETQKTA
jgi:hypothetical protein